MNSPFFNNVGGGWGPPGGLASVLGQYSNDARGAADVDLSHIADAWNKKQEEQKATYKNGKIAESFADTNPDFYKALKTTPEEFKARSATDKASAVAGYFQSQGAEQTKQEMAAKAADYAAQAAQRTQQAQDDTTVGTALNRYAAGNGAPIAQLLSGYSDPNQLTTPRGPMTADMLSKYAPQGPAVTPAMVASTMRADTSPQGRMDAALSTPGLGGRLAPKLIESLAQYQKVQEGADVSPRPFSVGGVIGAYSPKTGSMLMAPTAGGATQAIIGPDGEPIPGMYRAGKQIVRAPKPAAAVKVPAQFHAAMDQIGTQINSAQTTLAASDDDLKAKRLDPAMTRASAQKTLNGAMQRGKATVDRYHTTGYLTDDQRSQFYQELGMAAPEGSSKKVGGGAKVLTPDVAAGFLKQAGGDKAKARSLAAGAGYKF